MVLYVRFADLSLRLTSHENFQARLVLSLASCLFASGWLENKVPTATFLVEAEIFKFEGYGYLVTDLCAQFIPQPTPSLMMVILRPLGTTAL